MDFKSIGAAFGARVGGHCLPQMLYTDPAIFEFDMEAIYATSWLMAGFEVELPTPDSYLSMLIGKWPVIIVKDRAGDIRAFHNSCRHRGSMICPIGHGAAPKLVCPYHRWTYNLDGSLFAAGRMSDDFDKAEHGLNPVALECVEGVMFVCLAETPPSFDAFRETLAKYVAPHRFKDAKIVAESTLIENANWKLVMENARECYHCGTGHPELSKSFPVNMSAHFDLGESEATQKFVSTMADHGLATKSIEGEWWQVARFRLNDGNTSISMDGRPAVKKLMCEANGGNIGSMRWALDPHSFAHATADHVFMFSAIPVGPNETHVFSKWFVHKDAVEGVDYDVDALTELWTRTNLQDKALAENNQIGVNSRGYTPGPYSPDAEMLAQRFADWYCDKAHAYIAAHDH